MKSCPICQSTYEDAVDFCFKDGAPLEAEDAQPPAADSSYTTGGLAEDDLDAPDAISLTSIPAVPEPQGPAVLTASVPAVGQAEPERGPAPPADPGELPDDDPFSIPPGALPASIPSAVAAPVPTPELTAEATGAPATPSPASTEAPPAAPQPAASPLPQAPPGSSATDSSDAEKETIRAVAGVETIPPRSPDTTAQGDESAPIDPFGGHEAELFRERLKADGARPGDKQPASRELRAAAAPSVGPPRDRLSAGTVRAVPPAPKAIEDTAELAPSRTPVYGVLAAVAVALGAGIFFFTGKEKAPPPTPMVTATPSPPPAPSPRPPPAPTPEPTPVAELTPDATPAVVESTAAPTPTPTPVVSNPTPAPPRPSQATPAPAGSPKPPFQTGANPTPTPAGSPSPWGTPPANPTPAPTAASNPWGATAAATTATVTVGSQPAGAKVTIGGKDRGKAPVTLDLPAGNHEVRVEASGYATQMKMIKVIAGKAMTLDFPLEPLAAPAPTPAPAVAKATGTLNVVTAGGSAMLFVDGEARGKTPVAIPISSGTHRFRFEVEGKPPQEETVTIDLREGESKVQVFTLR